MVKRVLFASDLHARPDNPGREKIFLKFLATEAKNCDALYLLGDLFEFGFIFQGGVLPAYKPLIKEITDLQNEGIKVFFLGGNHDFWMIQYLRKRGLAIVHDGDIHEVLGKRIQLFHGILKDQDTLSRFASSVMQNPTSVWLYSALPSWLGFNLALKAAHISRKRNQPFPKPLKSSNLRTINPAAEIIISGHHHEPLRFEHAGCEFYVIGDWTSHFTYVEMTPGNLEIKAFRVNTFLGG